MCMHQGQGTVIITNNKSIVATYANVLWGKNLVNLANHELFAKIFLQIVTDTPKMYLAYALTVAYLPNFSSPIAFTGMVCQKFPCQNFLVYST